MNMSSKRSMRIHKVISLIVTIALVTGSFPAVTLGQALAGAEDSILLREPQVTPNGLGAATFDSLQFADPAAEIDLIQPPEATNQGDAQLSHPLSVPPGRAGLQPELSLNYSSFGGNGWVGLGWDLSLGEVTIDTRWGVPRYDNDPVDPKETETYLLDGDMLSPTAVRSPLLARETDRVFKRRIEGVFERIVRHGDAPGNYWWEVTDKDGTRRFYGGTPEGGRDDTAILADDSGNGFHWALSQVRDISNNTMTLIYTKTVGSGVGSGVGGGNNSAGVDLGREIYLESILYTGTVADGLPDDPAYEVRFIRASDLSEALRPDVTIDGRGGFLRVTSDLLRRIDVLYRGALTSQYTLNYTEGAFRKTLLASVTQAGSDGVVFADHTFAYHDDVRDANLSYDGFGGDDDWSTGNDNVGGIDLGGIGDGSASALGATETLGGDGRAYIGFNLSSPQKDGSFGGAFVLAGEDSYSRLELLDLNGDNLPDKVYDDGDKIFYRLNTSGPDGADEPTFGDPIEVGGISDLSYERSFQFGIGPEAYLGGASVMYNHAWAWAWGKSYFIDVNTDGLVDFVSDGNVLYNKPDANGNPQFAAGDADTGVPIDDATLDTSIFGDFSAIAEEQRAQSPLQDTLRRWRAPWNGTIQIQGAVQLQQPAADEPVSDGVRVAIEKDGSELWWTVIDGTDYTAKTPTGVSSIAVTKGADIYFRVGSIDDGASDEVAWDPLITYTDITSAPDANGLDVSRFQASEDFTLAGRTNIFTIIPRDGTLSVRGDFVKSNKTTDDITIQVLKNGTVVTSQNIGRDTTGTIALALADVAVAALDEVLLRLKIDSPVNLAAFTWAPELFYTDNTDIKFAPPVDTQIYPRNDLVAPQPTWTAPATGNITVNVLPLVFCDPDLLPICVPASESGTVAVTVKKKITPQAAGDPAAELVGKQILTVVNGFVTGADPAVLTVSVEKDEEYWFDVSVAQPGLGSTWQPLLPSIYPLTRHYAFIPDDVFPMPHRGWGIAGYNGDGALATLPVVEANLLFEEDDYPKDEPQLVSGAPDFPTSDDVDPDYKDPTKGESFIYVPYIEFDDSGAVVLQQWRGTKKSLFGSATGASSSRVGADSVGLPGSNELLGARAVTRFSLTEADALAGSALGLVGGSFAWGTSEGILDFFDMNGDEFPDIVGNDGVQYTTSRGGLESNMITHSELSDNVREDNSTSQTLGGGGTAAEIKADSKGDANTAQDVATGSSNKRKRSSSSNGDTGAAGSADDAQIEASLGFSGGVGWSSTNTDADDSLFDDVIERELADINGDGLPDLVTRTKSGELKVAFNIGYDFFATEVTWPGGAFEQGESFSFDIGGDIGFSTPSLSFSGGFGLSSAEEESISTWVDLNNDGLIDQLLAGNVVAVRFNTGAGLSETVHWGTFHSVDFLQTLGNQPEQAIATGETVGYSGGADFTIGIGPLCVTNCYIIINPGGHFERSTSRQELELNDVNGDGYPEHILSTNEDKMLVRVNKTGRTNLLETVTNSLGGSITLDYQREGNTTSQAFPQWVMSRVEVNDGRPGDGVNVYLTTYEYADNVYHALEREFLGYATVTEHERDITAGEAILRSTEFAYRNGSLFDIGLLERATLKDAGGTAVKESVNTWDFVDADTNSVVDPGSDATGVGFLSRSIFPRQIKAEDRRYDNGVLAKQTWNTIAYDALGNVTEIVDVGEPDLPADDAIATITYTDCTASTWVGLPDTFQVRDINGTLLRSRRAELLCANGAETKLWEMTSNGIEALTELDFNAYGSYNQIIYPANANGERYQVDYAYDTDRFTSIAVVTDSFGLVGMATYDDPTGAILSQTDANGQKTTYTYDAPGRLISITGPYEQGTGNATVTFEYFPNAPDYAYAVAHHFDVFNPLDTIDTVSFIDGLGRVTETKQDGTIFIDTSAATSDVMIVTGAAEFDALGRIVTEAYPITEKLGSIGVYNFGVDSVPPTLTEWDVEDRVTKVTAPDGSVTTTDYGFDDGSLFGTTMFLFTTTDALGNQLRSYLDMRGNLLASETDHDTSTAAVFSSTRSTRSLAVTQGTSETAQTDDGFSEKLFLSIISTGEGPAFVEPPTATTVQVQAAATNVVETYTTFYVYDPLQFLTQVTDTEGNITTHEYDLLGRRTATTTPDGGLVEFVYDTASQIIAKITPNLRAAGGQISYAYDVNRLVGISYTDGTPNVAYTYGAAGAPDNGAGRITQIEDGARIQLRKFGRLGEVVEETTTMLVHNLNANTEERLTWTMDWDYDTWARPKTITYPDGEVVTYDYDSGGLTVSAAGNKAGTTYAYVNRLEYDKFLSRRFMQTGNNVDTEIRYNEFTRRLERIISNAPQRQVQDITYSYDVVGNVLTADNDAPPPVPNLMGGTSQQTFTYDDLYRLVSADGAYQFAPNKERRYTLDMAYDPLNNIVRKAQTDAIFNNPNKGIEQKETTYDHLYDYGAAPHQPTHIGNHSYTYDGNGNLTGWDDDNSGKNRTVTWDAEDRVTSVADQGSTTVYTYDDENRLAIERGPQGETSFVNRFYTVRNGTVAWKHFWAGNERIATKREMPNEVFEHMLYFLHKDLLSSTNLMTESDGSIFQFLKYFPGGETWVEEHSNIHRTPYLYTGGYNDEFRDLYNLGARWYEPREQMFYSPDPLLVQDPGATIDDPTLLGAYTYAANNPVSFVDRTGLLPTNPVRSFVVSFVQFGDRVEARVQRFTRITSKPGKIRIGAEALAQRAIKSGSKLRNSRIGKVLFAEAPALFSFEFKSNGEFKQFSFIGLNKENIGQFKTEFKANAAVFKADVVKIGSSIGSFFKSKSKSRGNAQP